MRDATARAAIRRGSSIRDCGPGPWLGLQRERHDVLLPAPGGACSIAAAPDASAAVSSGSAASMGGSREWNMDRVRLRRGDCAYAGMRILKRILIGAVATVALLWLAMAVYAYWPQPDEIPVASFTADDRFVTVDGLSLRYRRWGDWDSAGAATKPTLLLIHGFGKPAAELPAARSEPSRLLPRAHHRWPGCPSSKPVEHDYFNGPCRAG